MQTQYKAARPLPVFREADTPTKFVIALTKPTQKEQLFL